MKVLLLNTFDHKGGAAIATYRLHQGLRAAGLDTQLMVQFRNTADPSVRGPEAPWQRAFAALRPRLDRLEAQFYPGRQRGLFSPAWLPERVASRVERIAPDIVHLFWVAGGFLRIETLARLRRPVVWTLHDMWPFTGGCHYDDGCGRFREACGACPVLGSANDADLSRRVWQRKHDSWQDVPIVVVATSNWIADMARASSLFRNQQIEVIPNGVDTDTYRPLAKLHARAACNLPPSKRLLLFSAVNALSDRRKGHAFLVHALQRLKQQGAADDLELIVVGAAGPGDAPDLGIKAHYMGHLDDEASQIALYSAADAVVAPSMQENLSNTVMESLACGTPVVAFAVGGMPDMIEHLHSGYLAKAFDPDDLAAGIMWVLEDPGRHERLVQAARRGVLERFSMNRIASRYSALYERVRQAVPRDAAMKHGPGRRQPE